MYYIPKGYQVTGMVLYFSNACDEIVVRKGYYANGSTNTLVYNNTSPGTTVSTTFTTPVSGDGYYIYIEFWNDLVYKFQFNGGYFTIARL